MNLMSLAQNGLSSAQAALNVVGNNLSNATTQGYSRQNIDLGEAGGRTTRYGFFGYGVQVDDVKRAYDGFVTSQVRSAAAEFQSLQSRYQQLSEIDNMLGDDTSNISTTLNNAFVALEKMSSDPVSQAAREEVLSQFEAVAWQFKSNDNMLNDLEKGTNTQITQSVGEVNSDSEQIATLNEKIGKIYAQTGSQPDDLLDQRDLLLNKLNDQVGIRVNENNVTGQVDVSFVNGLPLVNGNEFYQLAATASPENPSKTIVSYIDASGNAMRLDEDKISNGKFAGLFKFRNEDLVASRNSLNQLALQMANKFNTVNQAGYDLDGEVGANIFNISAPVALPSQDNSSDTILNVVYTDINIVNASDYILTYKGSVDSGWDIRTADGTIITPVYTDNGEMQFDGLSVTPQGTPELYDSFLLNPVSGSAGNVSLVITNSNQIAASGSDNPDEQSNNENIKNMIAIKNQSAIGKATLTEAYASLVGSVGSSMMGLKANTTTTSKVCEALELQQQSVSGVDLNEEYMNLQMFTQYYQANAQVLQTATTIFDTILNIR